MEIVAATLNGGTRAFIYVNGWLIGRYVNNVGPQHQFYVPAGILKDNGSNTLAIAVWGMNQAGGGLDAVSLVAGNLFYAWQAHRLSQRTGRPVTALPFGVNTVSLFAFIFLILGPVYRETHDADLA